MILGGRPGIVTKIMTNKSDKIEDKLALLKQSYRNQLPSKITEINEAAELPLDDGEATLRRYLETLSGLAHKLAGSGATFGFPDISTTARALEISCEEALNTNPLSLKVTNEKTAGLLDDLRRAVDESLPDENIQVETKEPIVEAPSERASRLLLFVSDGNEETTRLADEVSHAGFEIIHVSYEQDIGSILQEKEPAAVILESVPGRDDESALPIIEQHRERGFYVGPLFVISESGGMDVRLQAARAEAEAFIEKPVLSTDLVDILDRHLLFDKEENYRILIVDDDISTAKYTEVILRGAGMEVELTTDPMKVLGKLDDFGPELILMDLYMPQCSGQELAIIVRQQESFAAIPIVFLSGESNIDKQLVAMRSGGDDFLTKPIKPRHLISSVRTRVRRFRLLRSRMVRDSMTGLLNHTTTHEFLENEVARAHRTKSTLCLAALDIDHFKSVNDTYGHAVGDIVIKSLARLLRQRLRSNDVIGRMGGEEFAAVLGDTSIEEAVEIFNSIRRNFSEIEHVAGDVKFSVTLSCGIACLPAYQHPAELLEAADVALYEAKNSGRNKVVVSLCKKAD